MNKNKSIGQILEEEELAFFKRAGVKASVTTSAVLKDGTLVSLYKVTSEGKFIGLDRDESS